MFLTEAIFPKPDAASLLLLLLLTTVLALVLPPSTLCPAAEEGLLPSDPALLPARLLVLLATVLLLGSLKPAAVSAAASPASAAYQHTSMFLWLEVCRAWEMQLHQQRQHCAIAVSTSPQTLALRQVGPAARLKRPGTNLVTLPSNTHTVHDATEQSTGLAAQQHHGLCTSSPTWLLCIKCPQLLQHPPHDHP
jgi:hypothetical protein